MRDEKGLRLIEDLSKNVYDANLVCEARPELALTPLPKDLNAEIEKIKRQLERLNGQPANHNKFVQRQSVNEVQMGEDVNEACDANKVEVREDVHDSAYMDRWRGDESNRKTYNNSNDAFKIFHSNAPRKNYGPNNFQQRNDNYNASNTCNTGPPKYQNFNANNTEGSSSSNWKLDFETKFETKIDTKLDQKLEK